MEDDKKTIGSTAGKRSSETDHNNEQQALPVHDPLDRSDQREITQEDIENEQKYKEALTERD